MKESRVFVDCISLALAAPRGVPSIEGEFDWDKLYELAQSQRVTAIVARALARHPDWRERAGEFAGALNEATFIESTVYFETEELFSRLEEAGIDFFPFKGIVAKAYYPEPWLRYMKDVDILIRPGDAERLRRVFEDMGFRYMEHCSVHDVYVSPSGLYHIEAHTKLFSELSDNEEWGDDIFDRLSPAKPGGRRLAASDEDNFLIYLIHFDKHRKRDECFAMRALDFWFLPAARNNPFVTGEVKRLKLTRAYSLLNDLMRAWYYGEPLSRSCAGFERFVTTTRWGDRVQERYDAETYSWRWHRMKIREKGLGLLFPKKENMERLYPAVKARPALMAAYRPLHAVKFVARFIYHEALSAYCLLRGAASPL